MLTATNRWILALALFSAVPALADELYGGGSRDPVEDWYMANETYFGVPRDELLQVREVAGVHDDELPVVLFVARQAKIAPTKLADLRACGMSWSRILRHYDLSPDILYVEARRPTGVYRATYDRFQKGRSSNWRSAEITDEDALNLVNLRFISEHYGYDPDEVIEHRMRGRDFVTVNLDIRDRFVRHDLEETETSGVAFQLEHEDELYQQAEDYYSIEDRDVTVVRQNRVPPAEVPVLFYLAQQAKVSPATILELRRRGMTWMEITRSLRLDADIYHLPFGTVSVKADRRYGRYAGRSREQWRQIVLSDADVIELVNLRFLSESYGYDLGQVMQMLSQGGSFGSTYRVVIEEKGGRGRAQDPERYKKGAEARREADKKAREQAYEEEKKRDEKEFERRKKQKEKERERRKKDKERDDEDDD